MLFNLSVSHLRRKRSRRTAKHTDPSPQETNSDVSDRDGDIPPDRLSDEDNQDGPQVSCDDPTHLTKRTNTNITPAEVAANKPEARKTIRTEKPIRRGHFIMNFIRMC